MTIYYTFSFSGRQDESHRLLKDAISEYLGDDRQAGALVEGMKTSRLGKPYIDGFRKFSISHSNNAWAVLISGEECGLDIQFPRECNIRAISKRIYDPADADRVAALCDEDAETARVEFFRVWTRREALAKAMAGSAFESDLPSVAANTVKADGETYTLSDIMIPEEDDLYACVCIKGCRAAENIRFVKL